MTTGDKPLPFGGLPLRGAAAELAELGVDVRSQPAQLVVRRHWFFTAALVLGTAVLAADAVLLMSLGSVTGAYAAEPTPAERAPVELSPADPMTLVSASEEVDEYELLCDAIADFHATSLGQIHSFEVAPEVLQIITTLASLDVGSQEYYQVFLDAAADPDADPQSPEGEIVLEDFGSSLIIDTWNCQQDIPESLYAVPEQAPEGGADG